MSKTIEEIKNEYANEISPHGWFVMTMRQARITDEQVNEVAKRYAKAQTQELIEQNTELARMLLKCQVLCETLKVNVVAKEIEELLTKYQKP